MDDELKFYDYFGMPRTLFHIIKKLEVATKKQNTGFRKVISPIEKLMVCSKLVRSFREIFKSYFLCQLVRHTSKSFPKINKTISTKANNF